MRIFRRILISSLAGLAVASPSSGALATSALSDQLLTNLNATRQAAGLGAVTERSDWSEACSKHVAYMQLNGITHQELPGSPGYSPEGAWAGLNAVLFHAKAGMPRSQFANPWAGAPFHAMHTLTPQLTSTGVAVARNDEGVEFGCMIIAIGTKTRAAANSIESYPGNGTTGFPTGEWVHEVPWAPGDLVGLPQQSVIGPAIHVFADGPWVQRSVSDPGSRYADFQVTSAAMTGPGGAPVEIRVVDKTVTKWWSASRKYLGEPGAIITPVAELAPHTTYTVSVTLSQSIPMQGSVPTNAWCRHYMALPSSQQILGPTSLCAAFLQTHRDNCDAGRALCWSPGGTMSRTFSFTTGERFVAGETPFGFGTPPPSTTPPVSVTPGDDESASDLMDLPVVSRTASGPCDRKLRGRARIGGEWTEVMGYRRADHRVVSSSVRGRRAQVRLCTKTTGQVSVAQKGISFRAPVKAGTRTLAIALPKTTPKSLRLTVRLKGMKPVVTVVALKTSHR